MGAVEIVPAKFEHIKALVAKPLRKLDVMEWESGLGVGAKRAFLSACIDPALITLRAMLVGGEVEAIWGVTETGEEGIGSLWMMAAEQDPAKDYRPAFFQLWKGEIEVLHKDAPVLCALADDRNAFHHRWLKTMGFTALPEKHHAPDTTFTNYARRQP